MGSQVLWLLYCSCTTNFVPDGEVGVLLYLKVMFNISSPENLGLVWEGRSRSRVVFAKGIIQKHICIGYSGWNVANTVMKRSLKVTTNFILH